MPDIRYVCLSDLHFGAENSLLSTLSPGTVEVDPTRASPVLEALVAALAVLIGHNEDQSRKPTLILNGDVLELALADDNVALMVFELFLDRVFPPTGDALFDPTILYQAGNHDHHIWEISREEQYGQFLTTLAPGAPLPTPRHATPLFTLGEHQPVQAHVLDLLAQRQPHRRAVNFQMSYPNLGLRSADGRSVAVFHHGHYAESIYRLMTTLKDAVFPGRQRPSSVDDLEAENFAWIDFFWSTLGRSGEVGQDVGLIYDMLQSDEAIDRVATNLAQAIVQRVPHEGILVHFRWLVRFVLNRILNALASDVAASERRTPRTPMSPKTWAGLDAYLQGPLAQQLAAEAGDGAPLEQLKLVFGHTHKPFVDTTTLAGLAAPVAVFNTGGWVVDTLVAEPLHGANLVLADENLDLAAVRLYNQAPDPAVSRVRMESDPTGVDSPLSRRLAPLVQPDLSPWKDLSRAVGELVVEREKALASIIAEAGQPRKTMRVPQGAPTGTRA
jgi:UDP-2,3-diacylglucosamine pyrophosphatase LpxH